MLDRLPIHINPTSFAERGKILLGTLEISKLNRLSAELSDVSGQVDVNLSFSKEGRCPVLQGDLKAKLVLECQSCLKQVVLPIDRHFKLGFVQSLEQADRLASDCEPIILDDDKVLLTELIEDELLLALPDFPRHEYDCVEGYDSSLAMAQDEQQVKSNNPFSVLAKLKNTGD